MSKKMSLLLALVVVIAMIGVAFGAIWIDRDFINKQTVEKERAKITSVLRSEDVVGLLEKLDRQEILAILAQYWEGKYEKDSLYADLWGADYLEMTKATRIMELQVLNELGGVVYSQSLPGAIYDQKYVIVPKVLLLVKTKLLGGYYWMNILERPKTPIKLFILPDPVQDGNLGKEELGEVEFINEDFDIAIVKRTDAILGESNLQQYTLGKYQDLSIGLKLYRVSSHQDEEKGYQPVYPSMITEMHEDDGRNLFNFHENIGLRDMGGLVFTFNKFTGEWELVGMLTVIEPEEKGDWVYIIDINQILAYVESKIGTP